MSPEEREDQDFEAFMAGRDEISQEYRKLGQPQAPENLDDAVLRMSRAAVAAPRPRPAPAVPVRRPPRWRVPLALAATVVLSLSAILTLREDPQAGKDALYGAEDHMPRAVQLDEAPMAAPEPAAAPKEEVLRREPAPPPPPPAKPKPPAALASASGGIAADKRAAPRKPEPRVDAGAAMVMESDADGVPDSLDQAPAPQPLASADAQARAEAWQRQEQESRMKSDEESKRKAEPGRLAKSIAGSSASYAASPPPPAAAAAPTPMAKPSLVGAQEWIALIRKLRDEPNLPEARRKAEEFRRTFPDYPLPEDLKPLLQQDGAGK